MDLIQLKIEKDNSIIKYIKIIREFDYSLSIGAIKKRIEENNFVIDFDLEYCDVVEDINGIDRKAIFRDMIKKLCQAGAKICIYENGELITLEVFDNWLETINEIRQETEYDYDIERTLES